MTDDPKSALSQAVARARAAGPNVLDAALEEIARLESEVERLARRTEGKLSREAVDAIRQRRSDGDGVRALAREYGVSASWIVQITKHGYRFAWED